MLYNLLASLSEGLLTAGDMFFADKRLITIHISTILFFVLNTKK